MCGILNHFVYPVAAWAAEKVSSEEAVHLIASSLSANIERFAGSENVTGKKN